MKRIFLGSGIVAAVCLAGVTASNAATCQVTGGYTAAVGPSFTGPGFTYVITNFSLSAFSPCLSAGLGFQGVSTTLAGDVSINGGGAIPISSPGTGVTIDVISALTVGPTTTYSDEMTQLAPGGLPPGGSVLLRESPSQASTGQTTVTDLGGGNFQITSFFDVFTELSIDGGQTWIPSTGPTVLISGTPIPAALPLFAGGLGVIGVVAHRRKRKTIAA